MILVLAEVERNINSAVENNRKGNVFRCFEISRNTGFFVMGRGKYSSCLHG